MATLFTHAIIASGLTQLTPKTELVYTRRLLLCLIFAAVIPDIDVVAFAVGIPYQHPLGHRGFTHSLLFALLLALPLSLYSVHRSIRYTRTWWFIVAVLFIAGASHGLLDAMTDAGLGIGFFIPFDNHRYFFPYRPLKTSPIGVTRFFNHHAWSILKSEVIVVWLPVLLGSIGIHFVRRLMARQSR